MILSAAAAFVALWIAYCILKQLYENLFLHPNGPWGLPFIGYLPFLPDKPFHLYMHDLVQKYGPVNSIRIGEVLTIQLGRADLIREAFARDEMLEHGEANLFFNQLREAGERALITADGPMWKLNRKIAVKALSMFTTLHNGRVDTITQESIEWLLRTIENTEGKPVDTKPLFVGLIGANIWAMISGQKPDPESKLNKTLIQFVDDLITKATPEFKWYFLFPSLMKLKPNYAMRDLVRDDFVIPVEQEMAKRQYNENIECIADAIEKALRETDDRKKQEAGVTDKDIRSLVIDIYDGGYFLAQETMVWLILLVSWWPETQRKVQEEIERVVGPHRYPTLEHDWDDMPYLRACVQEGVRFSSSLAMFVFRPAPNDFKVGDHTIKKGTKVSANLLSSNYDPELFPEPYEYKPERFITSQGAYDQKAADTVMSFGTGRRRCPGQMLARQLLFLLLGYILQKFNTDVSLDPDAGNPVYETIETPIIGAGPHKIIFTKRDT